MVTANNFEQVDEFLETIGTISIETEDVVRSVKNVGTGNKCYVSDEQLIGSSWRYKENVMRYKLNFIIDTEANFKTLFDALTTNINKFNLRTSIGGYTRPTRMLHIELEGSGDRDKKKAYYNCNYYLRVKWAT